MKAIKSWLHHPRTRGADLDDPRTTQLRRVIIRRKRFLRRIYVEWYRAIAADLPDPQGVPGSVLEIGSGAGFLGDFIPGLMTSEIFYCPGVGAVLDGLRLPLARGALRAIVMTDVLHHLPQPQRFFAEAARCVQPGGALIMVEPWVSPWSRFVYTRLHHEPFRPDAAEWEFPSSGPLSGANGALPWIIFKRDRPCFEREFPEWVIGRIEPMMPFSYLVSGGLSLHSLAPGWSYPFWRALENSLSPWMDSLAMFVRVVLLRQA